MEDRKERNLLLLGAAILTVGLIIETLKQKVLGLQMSVVYKTLLIMFMIAVGYSFAAGIISPFIRSFLDKLKTRFINGLGKIGGTIVFYAVIYGVLFGLYLIVYVYGIKVTSFPERIVQMTNISS
jgi:hypothetical protein